MSALPKGQRAIQELPRFGLLQFQHRFPEQVERVALAVGGDVETPLAVNERFLRLPRTKQVSDLHCVTTWSRCGLEWSGVRFRDFYEQLVVPEVRPEADARLVVFRGQDGNCASLPLEDLLADDVLLADHLDGAPLSIAHGAPVRLVAPGHYGYKNIKHLRAIEFWRDARHYRYPAPWFLDHPRARVDHEERAVGLPNWFVRPLYQFWIPIVRWASRMFLARHLRRRAGAHSGRVWSGELDSPHGREWRKRVGEFESGCLERTAIKVREHRSHPVVRSHRLTDQALSCVAQAADGR